VHGLNAVAEALGATQAPVVVAPVPPPHV
jgi:hypothetical protein